MKLSTIIGKRDVVKSNAVLIVCAVLIAVNVGFFIFFPRLLAPLALVISNAITVALMIVAVTPLSNILKSAVDRKAQELVEKEKEQQALKDKVQKLENQNFELMSKLDTWGQMASAPTVVSFTAKVETMLYAKDGYIVKEEKMKDLLSHDSFKPSAEEQRPQTTNCEPVPNISLKPSAITSEGSANKTLNVFMALFFKIFNKRHQNLVLNQRMAVQIGRESSQVLQH